MPGKKLVKPEAKFKLGRITVPHLTVMKLLAAKKMVRVQNNMGLCMIHGNNTRGRKTELKLALESFPFLIQSGNVEFLSNHLTFHGIRRTFSSF